MVGSQGGVITEPWKGISPRLVTVPFLMIGRMTQSVGLFGGIAHPVATALPDPRSVILQSVEPWSNTQLCPLCVRGFAGSLFSCTELSGMNSEPAGAGKKFGDQLDAVFTGASLPITKPSAGNVEPSEQVAQATSCMPSDSAAVDASSVRHHRARDIEPVRPSTAERADIVRVVLIRSELLEAVQGNVAAQQSCIIATPGQAKLIRSLIYDGIKSAHSVRSDVPRHIRRRPEGRAPVGGRSRGAGPRRGSNRPPAAPSGATQG